MAAEDERNGFVFRGRQRQEAAGIFHQGADGVGVGECACGVAVADLVNGPDAEALGIEQVCETVIEAAVFADPVEEDNAGLGVLRLPFTVVYGTVR